jgi:hypothetical protein
MAGVRFATHMGDSVLQRVRVFFTELDPARNCAISFQALTIVIG